MDVYTASATDDAIAISAQCICTVVGQKALQGLLEASREMGRSHDGQGVYRDSHPWFVARELLDEATRRAERMPVMFAIDAPLAFSHWALVKSVEVRELHKGAWETECVFEPLAPVNPIWEAIDSVLLAPSKEQLRREALEPIHKHRQLLDATLIHPYAVCETPAFIATSIATAGPA